MRRFPDRVPAGDISRALDLKGSTLSNYLSHLMQVGLVTQERSGTSLLYAPDMDAMRDGRLPVQRLLPRSARPLPASHDLPRTRSHSMTNDPFRVLFICTGNSARSILPKRCCAISAAIGSMSIPPERNLGPN
jgi:hypothetical protein